MRSQSGEQNDEFCSELLIGDVRIFEENSTGAGASRGSQATCEEQGAFELNDGDVEIFDFLRSAKPEWSKRRVLNSAFV